MSRSGVGTKTRSRVGKRREWVFKSQPEPTLWMLAFGEAGPDGKLGDNREEILVMAISPSAEAVTLERCSGWAPGYRLLVPGSGARVELTPNFQFQVTAGQVIELVNGDSKRPLARYRVAFEQWLGDQWVFVPTPLS